MRFIIPTTAALVLALLTPDSGVAQTRQMSLSQVYNSCISLAMQRGWARSDLDGNRAGARNFVIRCMQGYRPRAQKR
jgi:hypothetical protein